MPNPVRWFEIYVDDMARARKFYEAVFQVKLEKLGTPEAIASGGLEMWSFPSNLDQWGSSGALVKMPGVPRGDGISTIVYFASEDCAIEEKRITQAGGKIERPKTSIGEYGFITLAVDPEGNVIGIHSMK